MGHLSRPDVGLVGRLGDVPDGRAVSLIVSTPVSIGVSQIRSLTESVVLPPSRRGKHHAKILFLA